MPVLTGRELAGLGAAVERFQSYNDRYHRARDSRPRERFDDGDASRLKHLVNKIDEEKKSKDKGDRDQRKLKRWRAERDALKEGLGEIDDGAAGAAAAAPISSRNLTPAAAAAPITSRNLTPVGGGGGGGAKLGDFVMTWYTFQDNTPCNSTASSSERPLIPYVSVAVPFRFLKSHGGPLNYGDQLYLKFLDGRKMPNGSNHTGWVQLDDFCGDSGDDNYCYQKVGGTKYPNVDLYVGDYTKSGMGCDGGPAGGGQEKSEVLMGPAPPGRMVNDYGGAAKGAGRCGDCNAAQKEQPKCQWHYTPKYEKWWDSVCK